jgi:hypothetical protein
MNNTTWFGIAALILFLLVGIGVQYQTLSEVITGDWYRGFTAFVMLLGRFAFAMFAIDLFRRQRYFAGALGVIASLVIAWMEWRLIGLHQPEAEYLVFARGFVAVSMLIEIMLSLYISGLEVEKEAEKVPEKVEAKLEKLPEKVATPKRKQGVKIAPGNRKADPEKAVKEAAEKMESETGKVVIAEVARLAGVSRPTARKYLNGSVQ